MTAHCNLIHAYRELGSKKRDETLHLSLFPPRVSRLGGGGGPLTFMRTGGSAGVSCPMRRPAQMSELQYRTRNKGWAGVNRRPQLISPPSLQIFIPGAVAWRSFDTPACYLRSETESGREGRRGVSRENGIRVMEAVP